MNAPGLISPKGGKAPTGQKPFQFTSGVKVVTLNLKQNGFGGSDAGSQCGDDNMSGKALLNVDISDLLGYFDEITDSNVK